MRIDRHNYDEHKDTARRICRAAGVSVDDVKWIDVDADEWLLYVYLRDDTGAKFYDDELDDVAHRFVRLPAGVAA